MTIFPDPEDRLYIIPCAVFKLDPIVGMGLCCKNGLGFFPPLIFIPILLLVVFVLDFCVATVVFELPLRFLFFITSVLRLRGRTTPCNFKNRPHALHKGWPSGLRRHNGVVVVLQLVHFVLELLLLLPLLLLLLPPVVLLLLLVVLLSFLL